MVKYVLEEKTKMLRFFSFAYLSHAILRAANLVQHTPDRYGRGVMWGVLTICCIFLQQENADLGVSVGCASDWWSGGCRFDPSQVSNILSWRFDHEIFCKVILSLPLIQEGHLSVSGKRMCTILVNSLEDSACPVKVRLGKLTILDMTPSRPRWLSWMHVRLETRRLWVRPPPRSPTFFHGDWSWNIFYGHSLPSADSRSAVVSFWRKNVRSSG